MNSQSKTQCEEELEELRARLAEAEETLNAIRTGEVDALVVKGPEGHAVYTLTGAERVYRLLVEAMNEGALVLSPDGSIIYSNHTFAAMLGLPLEHVIGSTVYDYVDKNDIDSLKEMLAEAVWAPGRKEITLRNDSSGAVPAHISVGSLDVEEAGDSISAVVTDLTEHKELECELEKYREHLEDLVEERTRQLKETVGQLKIEIESRKSVENRLAKTNEELSTANENLATLIEELRVTNDELIREAEGRRQVERALRESQRDLNRAQAVAHTGSWRMNIQKNELQWSDETYRMFGVAPETPLTYQLFLSFIHPDDRKYVNTKWQAALQGEPYDIEHRIIVGNTIKWVRETAELELDSQGKLLGGFGTVQDVTEHKEMEQERQRIFEREHHIAETLQQALVPSQVPHTIEGWHVAARYLPALREAQVGGDFYDVFQVDEGKLGVLIGDVVGKGLAAAIRVAAARYAVRSYAYIDLSPARIMTLTNYALCKEGMNERNVLTAFFGILDLETSILTYANAGHEPPLVRSVGGKIIELKVTGPMLGIVDCEYSESTIKLESGDSVIMYTDGITEARTKESILFEQEGVIDNLIKLADASPDQIAEALLRAATSHAGGNLQDDAAIVVLAHE